MTDPATGLQLRSTVRKDGTLEISLTSVPTPESTADDVVVRVAPGASGSRVEMRSKSRVGRGDAGTNARRIQAYFERLK